MPLQQEQRIGAFSSKYHPQPFEGEDDNRREWAPRKCFLVVRWQGFTNTLRDTVTIQQPYWTWRSRHKGKLNTCKTSTRVDSFTTDDRGKGKPSTGKGRSKNKTERNGKSKPSERKGKNKGNSKQHGKKGKEGCHEMEGHEDKRETQTEQEYTDWTDTSWVHADKWIDADWRSSDWRTGLWNDPALEQAARQLPSTQPAPEQSHPTHGGSISILGGFTMCELSVNDGE